MAKSYVDLVASFERGDIDASTFGHVDHLGVAYEMLLRHEFLQASTKYAACINAIATRAGAAGKFNTTITLAFLSLIAERMEIHRRMVLRASWRGIRTCCQVGFWSPGTRQNACNQTSHAVCF